LTHDLAGELRELAAWAERGGMPRRDLERAVGRLVDALLELQRLRRAADPRRLRTLERAARIAAADWALRAAGDDRPIQTLSVRYALSPSRVHQLLRLWNEKLQTSARRSPASTTRKRSWDEA